MPNNNKLLLLETVYSCSLVERGCVKRVIRWSWQQESFHTRIVETTLKC